MKVSSLILDMEWGRGELQEDKIGLTEFTSAQTSLLPQPSYIIPPTFRAPFLQLPPQSASHFSTDFL